MMPDVSMGETYDALLDWLATRASRLIDGYFKRKPGAFAVDTDETRYFDGSGCGEQWIDELAAAPTSVSVAEKGDITSYTAWASTDYMLWPYNALLEGMPYLRLDLDRLYGTKTTWYSYPKGVKVVGKFGFSTAAPDELVQAATIQVIRWFKRGQQGFKDVGAIESLGSLAYVKELDADVKQILDLAKYQRMTI